MAIRSTRTAVPDMASGYQDEFGPVETFATPYPALDRFNATGDMQMLQDATFAEWSWTVYRLRNAEEMQRAGTRSPRVFVTKTVGPFDVVSLQRDFGGGVYEIRGSFDGHLRIRHVQEIEGPRRVYQEMATPAAPFLGHNQPAPAPQYPQQHVAETSYSVDRRLDGMERLLERLSDRVMTPPAPAAPAQAPLGLADIITLADRMNQREVATPTGETIKEMMGVLRMGMDLKGEVTGGPETTTAERVLERVLPSLEKIAVGIFTNRNARVMRNTPTGPAPRAAARAPGTDGLPEPPPVIHHEPSGAAVIDPAGAEPAAGADELDGSHRWPAAIEALANSIEADDDPRDFPMLLERLLPDDDLAMLRAAPDESVLAQLRSAGGGAFPVLMTEPAAVFMRAMLAELRNPTDDEPETV